MGYQIPEYGRFAAEAAATPSPLAAGAQSALQTYAGLQQMQQQQQQQAQEQQLRGLQVQTAQQQLQALPQQIQAQQQQTALQQKLLQHQIAASNLSTSQIMHNYLGTRLADVADLPQNQQAQAYQGVRNEMISAGMPSANLPATFNQEAQNLVGTAYAKSPQVAAERKFQQQVNLGILKVRGQISAAAARAGQPVSPEAKAFGAEEGKKDSDYLDSVNTEATNAQSIYQDTLRMQGIAGQIPKEFGAIKGHMMVMTPEGQELLQSVADFVLKKFETMPHIGRGGNMMIRLIKDSKAKNTIAYPTFVKIVNSFRAESQRAMNKADFTNYLSQRGITNRLTTNNIWNHYTLAYPRYGNDGSVQSQNIGKWNEFLQRNPHLIGQQIGMQRAPAPTAPIGFRYPSGGEPATGVQ